MKLCITTRSICSGIYKGRGDTSPQTRHILLERSNSQVNLWKEQLVYNVTTILSKLSTMSTKRVKNW
ncbi:hypothetical protein Lalb_Chr15g0082061 [Lupinus albus]|uniref:Uncharacterized protein n=1 Tax=Lupinus albus TaxID=3870 RepID=A0A6A4NY88_LUPAL|nr:hypothetical protein Lalb_Chr15g0082061 [Lupinus albus]